jgi:S-adenosylmethionine:tRNA ribosyltransferase-isomerase
MTTRDVDTSDRLRFELPPDLEASEPPEAQGRRRDDVRMLVTRVHDGSLVAGTFNDLPCHLDAGDLVVVNTSATIPAAIDAVAADGTRLVVHLSSHFEGDQWIVELRRPLSWSTERWGGAAPAGVLRLGGRGSLRLSGPFQGSDRLWRARVDVGANVLTWLTTHGRPIQYGYTRRPWPLETYQNVYANEPGSAEMASAGRPFTAALVTRLVAAGVRVAPIVLHTGVSSLEGDELPYPERVKVPKTTAELVNTTRREGHQIVAVGTTVVRALESAVDGGELVRELDGWTELVIGPGRGCVVVDGVLTGWHEPVSSHLLMLESLVGRELLAESYEAALNLGYQWHEFGDTHLILP